MEVLQLFDSVDRGSHRIRCASTHSGTWRAQRRRKMADRQHAIEIMDPHKLVGSRAKSEMLLPRVVLPASTTAAETRYKKANAASRVVMGKWGLTQKNKPAAADCSMGSTAPAELGFQLSRRSE